MFPYSSADHLSSTRRWHWWHRFDIRLDRTSEDWLNWYNEGFTIKSFVHFWIYLSLDPTLQSNGFNSVTWILYCSMIFWAHFELNVPFRHRNNVSAVCSLRLNIWRYWYWCQASTATAGQTQVTSTATVIRGQRTQMPVQFMNSSLRGNRAVSRDRPQNLCHWPPTRQDVMICVNLPPVKSFYSHMLGNEQDSETQIQSRDCGDGELKLKWQASISPPLEVPQVQMWQGHGR